MTSRRFIAEHLAVTLCLPLLAASVHSQSVEQPATGSVLSGSQTTLHENAEVSTEIGHTQVRLTGKAYAAWTPQREPASDAGSLIMWVTPLWSTDDDHSHVFLSFPWSGSDQSYFVLSRGWWQPGVSRRLVVVLSNQDHVACQMPWDFAYTQFLPGQQTLLGVTWHVGMPGYLRLFVDGKLICESKSNFRGDRQAHGPLYVGSDLGTPAANGERRSDMLVEDLQFLPQSITGAQMRRLFQQRQGDQDPKWIRAIVGAEPTPSALHERRVMQDEDVRWASSRLEMRTRIERIKAAGFNVYMPNVWDGGTAYYAARHAPVSPSIRDPADANYDPLAYLITLAHQAGIAVHPWFIIVRHPANTEFPDSYLDGAPPDAFNVQSAEFRNFAVALVEDVAERYDVDGINLDYIQSLGICSSPQCSDAYARKYSRSLKEDWQLQLRGQKIPSLIEWNTTPVTDIVDRISAAVRKAKPRAILSIDANPLDHGSRHEGLDEERWLLGGTIDALVDMTYDDPIDVAGIDRAVAAYTPSRLVINVRNYDLFDDTWANRSAKVMSDYVSLIRKRWPSAGIGFYQYPHMDARQGDGLGRGVFAAHVEPGWSRRAP